MTHSILRPTRALLQLLPRPFSSTSIHNHLTDRVTRYPRTLSPDSARHDGAQNPSFAAHSTMTSPATPISNHSPGHSNQTIDSTHNKSSTPSSHFRVTLYRSPIGLTKRRRDSLTSLGLRRRMDVSYLRHSPDSAGLILSVKELLKVENVTEVEAQIGRKSSRKLVGDDRGYRLIRNVLQRD